MAVSSEFGIMLTSWPALSYGGGFMAKSIHMDDIGKGDKESVALAEIQIFEQLVL
jgi:hypothetical protein